MRLITVRGHGGARYDSETGGEGGIDRPGLAQTLLAEEFCLRAALDSKT